MMIEEILLVYGPLGIMVLGLTTAVIRLWKTLSELQRCYKEQLAESHKHELELYRQMMDYEKEMTQNYLEMYLRFEKTLNIFTERIRND